MSLFFKRIKSNQTDEHESCFNSLILEQPMKMSLHSFMYKIMYGYPLIFPYFAAVVSRSDTFELFG